MFHPLIISFPNSINRVNTLKDFYYLRYAVCVVNNIYRFLNTKRDATKGTGSVKVKYNIPGKLKYIIFSLLAKCLC